MVGHRRRRICFSSEAKRDKMKIVCWLLSSNLLYSTVCTVQYQSLAGHLGGLDRTRRPYVQMYCRCESCFRVDVNVARGIQQMLSIDQQKANIAPHLAIQKTGAMYQ
jgi:hypothetical protein